MLCREVVPARGRVGGSWGALSYIVFVPTPESFGSIPRALLVALLQGVTLSLKEAWVCSSQTMFILFSVFLFQGFFGQKVSGAYCWTGSSVLSLTVFSPP